MKILYPYNEILPKKTAHDVYLFRNCVSLAEEGVKVELLCGWSSLGIDQLHLYYATAPTPCFRMKTLPILRQLGPFSWNNLFFNQANRRIERENPTWVLTSVFKQAGYHVARKKEGTRYAYEVHQLSWYPNSDSRERRAAAQKERAILEQMDLVTVTTGALRDILRAPPYALHNPIEVVPLAVASQSLPSPAPTVPLKLMYIGQLYASQGVELLLRALSTVPRIHLEIIGGTSKEIQELQKLSHSLQIAERVVFHGFLSPEQLPPLAAHAHAFVAPFLATERMPYVAHTKLLEYASWGRPIVAPDLPAVREQLKGLNEELLFEAGNPHSLALSLQKLLNCPWPPPQVESSWKARASHYHSLLIKHS